MTEDDIVERMARAMFNDDEEHSDQWGWDQHPPRDWDLDEIEDCERQSYRRNARVAFAALQPITEAMVDAAAREICESGITPYPCHPHDVYVAARQILQAALNSVAGSTNGTPEDSCDC